MKYFIFRLSLIIAKIIKIVEIMLIGIMLINALIVVSKMLIMSPTYIIELIKISIVYAEEKGVIPETIVPKTLTEEDSEKLVKYIWNFLQNNKESYENNPVIQAIITDKRFLINYVKEHQEYLTNLRAKCIEEQKVFENEGIICYINYIEYDFKITNPLFILKILYKYVEIHKYYINTFKVAEILKVKVLPSMVDITATKVQYITNFMSQHPDIITKTTNTISLDTWEQTVLKAFEDYKTTTEIVYIPMKAKVTLLNINLYPLLDSIKSSIYNQFQLYDIHDYKRLEDLVNCLFFYEQPCTTFEASSNSVAFTVPIEGHIITNSVLLQAQQLSLSNYYSNIISCITRVHFSITFHDNFIEFTFHSLFYIKKFKIILS